MVMNSSAVIMSNVHAIDNIYGIADEIYQNSCVTLSVLSITLEAAEANSLVAGGIGCIQEDSELELSSSSLAMNRIVASSVAGVCFIAHGAVDVSSSQISLENVGS